MSDLYLHKGRVESVFQLLGSQENDITRSVAWVLAKSPSFLKEFLLRVINWREGANDVAIRLQHYEATGGITDIEIEAPGEFYVIAEAKRGWTLPTREQLEKYVARKSFRESQARLKRLIVLSECSQEYAEQHLEVKQLQGIPIQPLSYKDVVALATAARQRGSYAERRLLGELLTYLREVMTMRQIDSNWVYVVALAQGKPEGWGISWIDIVNRKYRYFHPVGGGRGGWPKDPPNYIAFRYGGKLQSIHHVEGYEVFNDPHEKFPEIPRAKWESHFLYRLGPGFAPNEEVKTGKIYPNGRVWCMLDTLFTCDTLSAARDLSQKRERQEA